MTDEQPPPILPSSHFPRYSYSAGQNYDYGICFPDVWRAQPNLERIQHLFQEQIGNDEVVLESRHKPKWLRRVYDDTVPFHEDILPHWEWFVRQLSSRTVSTIYLMNNMIARLVISQ